MAIMSVEAQKALNVLVETGTIKSNSREYISIRSRIIRLEERRL